MPQENEPKFISPKFPQIVETYGASAQGDSYALLTRKSIYQPTGNAFFISRRTQEEARVDVIFPGIDSEEPMADGFVVSVEESSDEEYEKEEGKLIEKNTWKREPIGKIAADDFPNDTSRISSEWTTEKWEYLNGIPVRKEITIRKPTIAVAGSYADFEKGEGLGLIPAEKIVETWILQSSSDTQNKYLHTVQNFKTRGELFPEYVAEWDNWTVGLGLTLDPASPEPEIVEIAPEPITSEPGQPIERTTEKKERDTYYPDDNPQEEPDGPLEPTQDDDPYDDPIPDDEPPNPDDEYEPDSPPWESEEFDNWDNPDERYLDDAPEDADLETVADTAAALARARQFPYSITHPIRKVDITSYQPLRRVHIAGMAFVRDGMAIALGSGSGGKELAISYTGLLIGKLNNSGIATPFYKSVTAFSDSVLITGNATLVDPNRAVATPDNSRVLVLGTIDSYVDPDYQFLCTSDGWAKAIKWVGTPGTFDYAVEIAPGANLLEETEIFAIGWNQLPNTSFTGATEITSFTESTTISWDNSTYPWISFIIKTDSPETTDYYRRGLLFYGGETNFYIYGR